MKHLSVILFIVGFLFSSVFSCLKAKDKEIHIFSSILNKPNEENKNIEQLVKENNFIHVKYKNQLSSFSITLIID